MKTTINIEDTVMAYSNVRPRQKRTMSDLVETALRNLFHRQPTKRAACAALPFSLGEKVARRPDEGSAPQRLENWKLARALRWPYFLRSTTRESRVRKPPFLSAGLRSGSK